MGRVPHVPSRRPAATPTTHPPDSTLRQRRRLRHPNIPGRCPDRPKAKVNALALGPRFSASHRVETSASGVSQFWLVIASRVTRLRRETRRGGGGKGTGRTPTLSGHPARRTGWWCRCACSRGSLFANRSDAIDNTSARCTSRCGGMRERIGFSSTARCSSDTRSGAVGDRVLILPHSLVKCDTPLACETLDALRWSQTPARWSELLLRPLLRYL